MPKIMQSLREEMRRGRGDHLTVAQFRTLAAINRGLSSNKEIGDLLGVSEAAISRMLDYLVVQGLIKKSTSKTDRRQKSLSLTNEGQKLFTHIRSDARTRLSLRLTELSESDAKAVIQGLEILQKNLFLFEGE